MTPPARTRPDARSLLAVLAIITLAILAHGLRLADAPLKGEETRRGRFASEILSSGDWIVTTQQMHIWVDRPPLQYWLIAISYSLLGESDVHALRLPSLLASTLAALLAFWTARRLRGDLAGLLAGAMLLSMGLMLDLGARAETDAIFTALLAASLLTWLHGYRTGMSQWTTWILAGALAGLATLAKGTQGPITFLGTVWLFLLFRRDWRWLLSPAHAAGLLAFAGVYAAWFVPLVADLGWSAAHAAMVGPTTERFNAPWWQYIKHASLYAPEVLIGMLPWSPLLFLYALPRFRRTLADAAPDLAFLFLAILILFIPNWIVPWARGRYFLPAYPLAAILCAIAAAPVLVAAGSDPRRRLWFHFARASGIVGAIVAVGLLTLWAFSLADSSRLPWFPSLLVILPLSVLFALAAAAFLRARHEPANAWPACLAMAFALAGLHAGVIVHAYHRTGVDLRAQVLAIRDSLPPDAHLQSLGLVNHRFTFWFERPIERLEPTALPDLFFCFDHRVGEPITFPFPWEELAAAGMDVYDPDSTWRVVVARRLSP